MEVLSNVGFYKKQGFSIEEVTLAESARLMRVKHRPCVKNAPNRQEVCHPG